MPKLKLSKSIIKRFKVSSTGKIFRHKSGRNHLLEKKSQKRKKKLCKVVNVNKYDLNRLKNKLSMYI